MRGCPFLLLSCLLVSVASAEIPIHLEGQLGGTSQAVAVAEKGDMAYLGVGPRVVLLDVSEPNTIREIAQSEVLPEVVEDIVVRDGYAYVADGSAGLYVLDVSGVKVPSIVGRWSSSSDFSVGRGRSVCLSGRYAYFADGNEGLHIIDISNPAEPVRVGVATDVSPVTVAVANGCAYVNVYPEGLATIDVTDPMRPSVMRPSETLPEPTAIEVVGGLMYVTGRRGNLSGLFIFDVNEPTRPSFVGWCEIDNPGELAIDGKVAYVTNVWGGLDIIRIIDPALPSRVGRYEATGPVEVVALAAGRAYIAGGYGGLEVVDVSSPTAPVSLAGYANTVIYDVAVSDRYAYAVGAYTGMQIVDISDPAAPSYVSWLDLYYADCVALGKTHVYVGDARDLRVIDVSDPLAPVVIASCELGCEIGDIVMADRYAYLATDRGLTIVDVADPHRPLPVGQCDTPGQAWSLCVADGYAYTTGPGGLDIIDISNPAAPFTVGRYQDNAWPYHAAVSGPRAFLAGVGGGLGVIDISDPELPGYVWSRLTHSARDVAIREPWGLLLDSRDGLSIFEVSNPFFFPAAGECDVPGYAQSLVVVGDYAYVASLSGGLVVLKIDWPTDSTPE